MSFDLLLSFPVISPSLPFLFSKPAFALPSVFSSAESPSSSFLHNSGPVLLIVNFP